MQVEHKNDIQLFSHGNQLKQKRDFIYIYGAD